MASPSPKPEKPPAKPVKPAVAERVEALVKKFQAAVITFASSRIPQPREKVDEAMAGTTPRVRKYLEEYAWAKSLTVWLFVGVLVNLLLVVFIFIGANSAASRPIGFVKGLPSIADRARVHMTESFAPSLDTISLYLNSVLPLLQNASPNGQPNVGLLRGMVAEDVLARASSNLAAQMPVIKKNSIFQALMIDSIGGVVISDEEAGTSKSESKDSEAAGSKKVADKTDVSKARIGVYVRGYFIVGMFMTKTGPKVTTVPYRARVVLELNYPSKLNPTNFFLLSLQEKIGVTAPEWDRQQNLQK